MSLRAIKSTTDPGAPQLPSADPLDSLHEERARVADELQRLSHVGETHAAAAAALVALDAEQRAIDESERTAWSSWVRSPQADAPKPLTDRRLALAQRRALAAGDLAAALNAEKAVAPRLDALNAQLRAIGAKIFKAMLEGVVAEVPEIQREIFDGHERQVEGITRLRGLHAALCQEVGAARARGDEASASVLQAAIGEIEKLKSPEGGVTYGAVQIEAARIRETLR